MYFRNRERESLLGLRKRLGALERETDPSSELKILFALPEGEKPVIAGPSPRVGGQRHANNRR